MPFALDDIANGVGTFAILAMDQRGTLRKMLDQVGQPSADHDLSAFKVDVISALSPYASAVLTDVEHGVAAVRDAGALAPDVGLLISSERSPQPTWNGEHRTEFLPDRGPQWVAANGGVALKFLTRWRPDRPAGDGEPDLSKEAIDAVAAAVEACRKFGMPAVIEPLVTKRPGEQRSAEQQHELVIRSAELLSDIGPDLLKLEWPGDVEGCQRLTKVCSRVPWALLSAGVGYEQFVGRVVTAMDAGATGFIAGRAIWGEAVELAGDARRAFLRSIAADRMQGLVAAIAGHGRSWREVAGVDQ